MRQISKARLKNSGIQSILLVQRASGNLNLIRIGVEWLIFLEHVVDWRSLLKTGVLQARERAFTGSVGLARLRLVEMSEA